MKVKSEREVAQSCMTLRDPMDRSLPGSSVHGIFQEVLEWGAIRNKLLSNKRHSCLPVCVLSRARLFATPWTPGSSVHGIFQAGVVEWDAIAF